MRIWLPPHPPLSPFQGERIKERGSFRAAGLAVWLVLGVGGTGWCAFEPAVVGARAAGVSEAVVAVADDATAGYYNPAGLLKVPQPELMASYSRLFLGLDDGSQLGRSVVMYGQQLKGLRGRKGAVGLQYLLFQLPSLYKEETVGVSYAQGWDDRLNLGVTGKVLRVSLGGDEFTGNAINPLTGATRGGADPVIADASRRTRLAADVGAQWRITSAYTVGVSVANLNQPNIALSSSDVDRVSRVYRFGVARRTRNLTIALDGLERKFTREDFRGSLGIEKWWGHGLAVRGGFGAGSRDFRAITVGAAYQYRAFQVDYGFSYPITGITGTAGTHVFGFTVRFGTPPLDEATLEARLETEVAARQRLEAELQEALAAVEQTTKAAAQAQTEVETLRKQGEEPALSTAERLAQVRARQAGEAKQMQRVLEEDLARWQNRKGTLPERLALVQRMIQKYQRWGLDPARLEGEREELQAQLVRIQEEYQLAWRYYQKLVQGGATVPERRELLERTLKRYQAMGVEVTEVQQELTRLQGGQP
ncbi:MAG: conjugal transfer protein TraF [Elusimicrobia bacterium]|nr:conjugal transfer protein TraF [Elusimicrobiota bacterium]